VKENGAPADPAGDLQEERPQAAILRHAAERWTSLAD
jgi:hypothetical protein